MGSAATGSRKIGIGHQAVWSGQKREQAARQIKNQQWPRWGNERQSRMTHESEAETPQITDPSDTFSSEVSRELMQLKTACTV